MRNFKQLKIWQKGFEIASECFGLVQTFPKEERFGISNQITRAGVSSSSNIAEGGSRSSEKDYKRCLEIALGYCFELETQVLIASSVKYGNGEALNSLLKKIDEEQKMIISFINKLK